MADLKDAIEGIKKTIEDAVASGDLIPRADAQAAVALVVERAAKIATRHWEGEPEDTIAMEAAIRALASVDGLAMVQELQAERDSYRAALAQTPTDPGDGWTWNERLGWIGPDGKPADPRRRG